MILSSFVSRYRVFLSAFCAAVVLTINPADAQQLPSKPSTNKIPNINLERKKVGGITFHSTAVTRLGTGEILVLYGFSIARLRGEASMFYWNPEEASECSGVSRLGKGGVGVGELMCSIDGRTVLRDDFIIPAGKYMKPKSTVHLENVDLKGRKVTTIIQWHRKSSFPDAQWAIKELQ